MRCKTILFTFIVVIFSVNCLRIVYKSEWQQNSNEIYKSKYEQASFVVLCQTGGLSCDTEESCIRRVQSIQKTDLMKWGTMIYNYLIGGDGRVYEGSGFYERANFLGFLKHQCLLIAFIGDFRDTYPSNETWNSLNNLLNFAKQLRYINEDYGLLSSTQIDYVRHFTDEANISEDFVYQTIKTFSTWKNITLIIEDQLFPV